MRCIIACCVFLVSIPVFCCAGIFTEPDQSIQLKNPKQITIIIPNSKDVDASKFTQINFDKQWGGRKERQEKLFFKDKSASSFKIERRTDNGRSGSGIIYDVNYSLVNDKENTILTCQPKGYKTYQQGLVLPFEVPVFTENDLNEYIIKQHVYYNLELNSQYNTESTYANFARLLEKAPFKYGEKDPVTGKIFKDRFFVPYKDAKISFTLETFPYRNGSKAVMHIIVPGSFTSDNVVDFGVILKEIKAQLEGVINS